MRNNSTGLEVFSCCSPKPALGTCQVSRKKGSGLRGCGHYCTIDSVHSVNSIYSVNSVFSFKNYTGRYYTDLLTRSNIFNSIIKHQFTVL